MICRLLYASGARLKEEKTWQGHYGFLLEACVKVASRLPILYGLNAILHGVFQVPVSRLPGDLLRPRSRSFVAPWGAPCAEA